MKSGIGALILLLSLAAGPARAAPCTPAAALFGQTLCAEALAADADGAAGGQPDSLLGANAQAQQLQQRQAAMEALVWRTALIHRFGAAAVTPGKDEIDEYRRHLEGNLSDNYGNDLNMADYLKKLLDTYIYPPDRERQLTELSKNVSLSVSMYGQRQAYAQQMPKEYQSVVDAAENKVAADMLTAWKQDKALFDTYGGRVVALTDGRLQPVDAYRKFYAWLQAQGAYKSFDPAYAGTVSGLDVTLSAVKTHATVPPAVATRYYATPWQTDEEGGKGFIDWKQRLDSIPTLGLKKPDADPSSLVGHSSLPPDPLP